MAVDNLKRNKQKLFSYFIPQPTIVKDFYTLDEVVEEYYEYIGKLAFNKLRKHKQDAEDLQQMIFLRIIKYYDGMDHKRLAMCISQHCFYAHKDWLKTCYREIGDPNLLYSMYDTDFHFKDPESLEADPFLNYLRDNAGLCLANKLTMLSKSDASIFALYYLSDCNTDDVALEMGVTKKAVYTRICRIRADLSVCYSSHGLEDFV